MQKTDEYPHLGWDYDDLPELRPSRRVVYGGLAALAFLALLVLYGGYHGYELVRPFI